MAVVWKQKTNELTELQKNYIILALNYLQSAVDVSGKQYAELEKIKEIIKG